MRSLWGSGRGDLQRSDPIRFGRNFSIDKDGSGRVQVESSADVVLLCCREGAGKCVRDVAGLKWVLGEGFLLCRGSNSVIES